MDENGPMLDASPAPRRHAVPLGPEVTLGDFVIERRLGSGGMGVVYQARQVSLDRVVALKVLGDALNRPEDIARFRREAQAVAKLDHPNIAGRPLHRPGRAALLHGPGVRRRRLAPPGDRRPRPRPEGRRSTRPSTAWPRPRTPPPVVRFDAPTVTMPSPRARGGRKLAPEPARRPGRPRPSTSAAASRSPGTPPWPWPTPTSGGWSTATSSPRTCCSTARGRSA